MEGRKETGKDKMMDDRGKKNVSEGRRKDGRVNE